MMAYAYRSGQIGFAGSVPDGALFIAKGPEKVIGPMIRGLARLAYDNETYLVPGVPEAEDDDRALKALLTFMDRVKIATMRRAQLP